MTSHADGRPLSAVAVTWMDGKQEIYPATRYRNSDGVLLIAVVDGQVLRECVEVPLVNVRIFRPLFCDA